MKLSRFPNKEFDLVLVFGPMYHLYSMEDKVKALTEARRVLKDDGVILVAYCMNEYSVLTYGFKQNHILECIENGKIDDNFRVQPKPEDLYDYSRLLSGIIFRCVNGRSLWAPDHIPWIF